MGASVNQGNGTTQSGVLSQGLGIARDQSRGQCHGVDRGQCHGLRGRAMS